MKYILLALAALIGLVFVGLTLGLLIFITIAIGLFVFG